MSLLSKKERRHQDLMQDTIVLMEKLLRIVPMDLKWYMKIQYLMQVRQTAATDKLKEEKDPAKQETEEIL